MHRNLVSANQAATVAAALDHIVSDANYVDALLGAIAAVGCA